MASDASAIDWPKLVIGMLGGDKREQEIARRAAATGADVRAHGFPWPEQGIPGVRHFDSPAAVLEGARFALFPIPGIAASGALFASAGLAPIIPDRALLSRMAPRAHIILGWADAKLKAHAEALSIKLHEYEWDRSLMLQRTPAIIEGLLRIVIENTAFTIHNATTCVVGQGTIGAVLARYLVALGAHTHVAARNAEQRAAAYVAGATPHLLEDLPQLAPSLDLVFSTVPSRIVG
jgi:dipicolinate synthase subunit A